MECPYCKEEIKDNAIKCKHCGSIIQSEEKTVLKFNGFTITNKMFITPNDKLFPLNNIYSVKQHIIKPHKTEMIPYLILSIIFVILLYLTNNHPFNNLPSLVLLFIPVVYWILKKEYYIVITTNNGDEKYIKAKSKEECEKLINALNNEIENKQS